MRCQNIFYGQHKWQFCICLKRYIEIEPHSTPEKKNTKKINIFMKIFQIPIGQRQKYGWKWKIAIGLRAQNVTKWAEPNVIYMVHTRDRRANEITLNGCIRGTRVAVCIALPFHCVSFTFILFSSMFRTHFPNRCRLFTRILANISFDWGAITKGYERTSERTNERTYVRIQLEHSKTLCNI